MSDIKLVRINTKVFFRINNIYRSFSFPFPFRIISEGIMLVKVKWSIKQLHDYLSKIFFNCSNDEIYVSEINDSNILYSDYLGIDDMKWINSYK